MANQGQKQEPNPAQRLDGLTEAARGAATKGLPPVHLWNPPFCGDLDMRIASDGTWFYLGTPIGRHALVKLFSTILKREDGKYFLVTPVEKVGIRVDDAPFLAVEMEKEGEGAARKLNFRTNVDDVLQVDAEHPMRFVEQPGSGGLKPYVRVRGRLEALVTRAVYADLVALAIERDGVAGIWSGGCFWPLAATPASG